MASTGEKLRCILRELGWRRYVFRKRIDAGHMSELAARHEIETMEEIAQDYRALLSREQPKADLFTVPK